MNENTLKAAMYENDNPKSPDVIERKTADDGFSDGWGMHFMPVEKYWADIHTHLESEDADECREIIKLYRCSADKLNVKFSAVITILKGREQIGAEFRKTVFQAIDVMNETRNITPMLYIDFRDADPDFIDEAVQAGIKGIKLHNAPVIEAGESCRIWQTAPWRKVFERIEKNKLPVLWHVTQRLTDSPYNGGGRNTYWKNGWLKGVTYTNKDLLDIFLETVSDYPGISFIGAHQLHMGWERIAGLFNQYSNLHVDTSCGCIVKEFDNLHESDRNYLRKYFIDYSDRILFGTDTIISKEINAYDINVNYTNHIRFIRQLRLPYEELQMIAYGNFERLFQQTE